MSHKSAGVLRHSINFQSFFLSPNLTCWLYTNQLSSDFSRPSQCVTISSNSQHLKSAIKVNCFHQICQKWEEKKNLGVECSVTWQWPAKYHRLSDLVELESFIWWKWTLLLFFVRNWRKFKIFNYLEVEKISEIFTLLRK